MKPPTPAALSSAELAVNTPEQHQLQRGFTLIELMITIVVMAILGSLAAPALGTFVTRSTMRGISNDFTLGLQRARMEAINRNECVVMCISNNSTSASPTCVGSGTDWAVGWIVASFPQCTPATLSTAVFTAENIVLTREGTSPRFPLISQGSSPANAVTFNARGVNRLGDAGKFNLRDAQATTGTQNAQFNRSFCLDQIGRVRTIVENGNCS